MYLFRVAAAVGIPMAQAATELGKEQVLELAKEPVKVCIHTISMIATEIANVDDDQ